MPSTLVRVTQCGFDLKAARQMVACVCVVIPVQQLRSARQPVELHWQPAVIKHCCLIHTM